MTQAGMSAQSDPREYVLRTAKDNDVKFIRLWFADILGHLKGFAITVAELEGALERGMAFDGSAIEYHIDTTGPPRSGLIRQTRKKNPANQLR